MSNSIVLKKHRLPHIGELRVNDNILSDRFSADCSMYQCNAQCCRGGVWVDVRERDRILAHTEMIQRHMEGDQERRPEFWFEPTETVDADFPSGKATGTIANEKGCVFLLPDGKCVLQKATTAEGMGPYAIKPFYCVSYPVTVEGGELMMDELETGFRSECCCAVPSGTKSILDVCEIELKFVLGEEGFEEFRSNFKEHNKIEKKS